MQPNCKHVFLTGEIQVGKSTIIRRFLERVSIPAERLGGFLTVTREKADGGSDVYILPPAQALGDREPALSESCRILTRLPKDLRMTRWPDMYPATFESVGVSLLETAAGAQLVLMDELGFAETNAPRFQQAVLAVLDGSVPVLGVMKKFPSPFLRQVEAHPRVQILEVDEENREQILQQVVDSWLRIEK